MLGPSAEDNERVIGMSQTRSFSQTLTRRQKVDGKQAHCPSIPTLCNER